MKYVFTFAFALIKFKVLGIRNFHFCTVEKTVNFNLVLNLRI